MVLFYALHLFGKWEVQNYRPDADTTYTVLLYNTCAVLHTTHTLRPNTDVSSLGDGTNGTKLGGSFMDFWNGHIVAILIFSLVMGLAFFATGRATRKEK